MSRFNSASFRLTSVAVAIISSTSTAYGFNIDTGSSDFRLSLDNTVKYSTALRLEDASPGLTNSANQNDGNNNFDKGLVSNRLDLFSELDGSYKNMGFRVSGAAWYDDVYNGSTDNTSSTANNTPASEFSDNTKKIMGDDAEILDAFVYGYFPVMNGMEGTVRLGRHSLLWGESLFFGSNGIAGGQAPNDVVKLLSVPNSTFKETVRPTGKLSVDIPISDEATIGAYIGYEWEASRIPPVGSYLSSGDAIGSDVLLAGTSTIEKTDDEEASDSGQYGLQLRWTDNDLDADFGLYAIRYNAYSASNQYMVAPSGFPEQFKFAYAEGIEAYGASMAKSVGVWGLAMEVSYRRNAPLQSKGQTITATGVQYDNNDNPGYAVGETAHAQFSWMASLGPSFISKEASFMGEIAWNTRVKTTENESMLNPNADRSAVGLRMVYSPTYRQAFDGLDLSPSVGFGHTWGKSSAVGAFGVDGGGDVNVGIKAVYLDRWNMSLSYTKFLGEEGNFLDDNNYAQYKQTLKDRDFLAASINTTF
ncbi:DUF1302 domain-containing protein [Marinomonas posidonica]|uniref:DUF1302 domain-containing protein n=1 Tax=Marinomonas posidonica (strain CECT 7376 / NCIMB 14433 / IVIA-Po-181) TaxID=491952 RepID=F6CW58_MARPP|nr:DUF1302 family protein [Marinomonas posidonica]AEF55419.1 protein of unknown function DUF1302 [Marinomonas posidonica IVIA-Po-181]